MSENIIVLKAKVAAPAFLSILWAGTGLALSFVIFRIAIRIKSFHKLYADDYLVILAWFMLLGNAILWQTQHKTMYQLFEVDAGKVQITPEFIAHESTLIHSQLAFQALFYSCLWAVKVSFLIFFRRLESKAIRGFTIWWWIVLGITVAMYLSCIADMQFPCLVNNFAYVSIHCTNRAAVNFEWATLRYNTAADVVSDALIITIPIVLLWNIRINIRQKIALFGLFSLTVTTMAFAIVRVSVVVNTKTQADISWLYTWSNIEIIVSIIVACLGSFRQLFVKQGGNRPAPPQPTFGLFPSTEKTSFWRRGLLSLTRRGASSKSNSGNSNNYKASLGGAKDPNSISHENIIPMDSIHVKNDLSFRSNSLENGEYSPSPVVTNAYHSTLAQNKPQPRSYQEI